MRIRLRACPRADELVAIASGSEAAGQVAAHIANCGSCAQIVDSLRRDAALIGELRSAASAALDEDTHRDIINSCRAALDQDDRDAADQNT